MGCYGSCTTFDRYNLCALTPGHSLFLSQPFPITYILSLAVIFFLTPQIPIHQYWRAKTSCSCASYSYAHDNIYLAKNERTFTHLDVTNWNIKFLNCKITVAFEVKRMVWAWQCVCVYVCMWMCCSHGGNQ